MPSRFIQVDKVDPVTGATYAQRIESASWVSSPRVNGKIRYRPNPYNAYKAECSYHVNKVQASSNCPPGCWVAERDSGNWDSVNNDAYGRFRGKLYKGSASLGVTMASYRQSASMIAGRYGQLIAGLPAVYRALRQARSPKQLANTHLEIIFGWLPLYSDIHAATSSVIQQAPTGGSVRASAMRSIATETVSRNSTGITIRSVRGTQRVTYSAMYSVTNPNLWLVERAGLLNPAAVAWDLVPWSFAVNWFVNVNQLVQSVSDYAGLTFTQSSQTSSARLSGHLETHNFRNGAHGVNQASYSFIRRGTFATPSAKLTLKAPNGGWSQAATAASLFTQRMPR